MTCIQNWRAAARMVWSLASAGMVIAYSPCVATIADAAPLASSAIGAFKLDRAPEQGSLSLGWAPAGATRISVNGQGVAIAPDGRFLVGFGRDYGATAEIVASLADGRTVSESLPVLKRAWEIEYLPTVARFPQLDAEFQARRPAELAQINATRQTAITSEGWRQSFIWPAKGRISGHFGSQCVYAREAGAPHSGVDVAGPAGAPVVAPADGVVTLAADVPFTLEGNLLIISHGMGLDSTDYGREHGVPRKYLTDSYLIFQI